MERARATSTDISSESFVFSNTVDGSLPWHPDSTSRAFRRICQQAGIPAFASMICVTMSQRGFLLRGLTCVRLLADLAIEIQARH